LNDLSRRLGDGFAVIIIHDAKPTSEIWAAVEVHGETGKSLRQGHADLEKH
jgi:hypothetical protein